MTVKPARWAVNPAMVGLQWRWAWRDLFKLIVAGDEGKLFDVADHTEYTIQGSTATSVIGPYGTGSDFSTNGGAVSTDNSFLELRGSSGVVLLELNSDAQAIQTILTRRVSTVGTRTYYIIFDGSADQMTVGTNVPTAYTTNSPTLPSSGWHVVGYSIEEFSFINWYLDGVHIGRFAFSGSNSTNGSTWQISRLSEASGSFPYLAPLGMVGLWSRVLTAAEHAQIAADPFGPIRPAGTLIIPQVSPITLRYVYPSSDILATGWDTAPTPSQPLYAQLDEEPADSADYVFPT